MQLNEKQQLAVNRATDWYAKQNTQIFKMAGYAGTGKTTVATTIARTLESDENTLYCAFTGKAACVMRQKGMPGQTIHSAIYDYETVTDPQTGKQHVVHHLKPRLPYKLIVVDEASMVGTEIAKDLLSFQIPILAIGDPGQLPPVGDRYSDLLRGPDIVLDEIMRQDGGIMGKPWDDDVIDSCNRALDNCFASPFSAWLHITSVKRSIRHLADALRLTLPEPKKDGD